MVDLPDFTAQTGTQYKANIDAAFAGILDPSGELSLLAIDKIVVSDADIVDAFLYDTSKDTDGGAWRERVQHTSWYNETLSTATRGATRKFPALALIVALSDTLTIYDATDPELPMWMVFNGNVGGTTALRWADGAGQNVTSITAKNGIILAGVDGGSGVDIFKFIADTARVEIPSGGRNFLGNLSERNDTKGFGGQTGPGIVNATIKDVAITVLQGSPIDEATGLPTPTIAVATGVGFSVIVSDENIWDVGAGDNFTKIKFADETIYVQKASDTGLEFGPIPTADISRVSWREGLLQTATIPSTGAAGQNAIDLEVTQIPNKIALAMNDRITLLDRDITTLASSMVAYITKDFASGWLPGDIRGAWLAQSKTADRSIKGNTLTENGTVTEGVVATGAELKAYSGFTAANNLTRAFDADLDFGTGDVAFEFWFKSSGNAGDETLFERREPGRANQMLQAVLLSPGTVRVQFFDGVIVGGVTSSSALDDGVWHFIMGVLDTSGTDTTILYVDGIADGTAVQALNTLNNATAILAVGVLADSTNPALTSSMALLRFSAYAPTAAQIKKMYEDEKFLFVDDADCLLAGTSNAVAALAYDSDTDSLLVGTGDGTSFFRGLERTTYVDLTGTPTSDAIVTVAATRGAYLIGTAAEAVYNEPAHNLREENVSIDRDTQPPQIELTGSTVDATASVVVATLSILEGESLTVTLNVDAAEPTLPGGENASYVIVANVYRAVGGNVTVQGQTAVSTIESTGSMACVVAANTTDQTLEVQVTGVASTVLAWTTQLKLNSNIERWAA